jgi:hypothetical protein
MNTIAKIAAVSVFDDNVIERIPTNFLRQSKSRRLIDPHQRRMQNELAVHAEFNGACKRLQGDITAIGIS